MNLLRRLLKMSIIFNLALGSIGCSSTIDGNVTTQQEFIKLFEVVINHSLEEQQNLWDNFEKYSSYTEEDYKNDMIDLLQDDIDILNKNKWVIKDRELTNNVNNYIGATQKQVEALSIVDKDRACIYEIESNELEKNSLASIVESYGIKIKDDNNEILEEVMTVYKENKPQKYADTLAKEILFNEFRDDFGDISFSGIFENKSNLNFKNLSFKVEYKDKSGDIVYNDYISIKNFSPGAKKKINLRPYENKVVAVNLVTDWYEVK